MRPRTVSIPLLALVLATAGTAAADTQSALDQATSGAERLRSQIERDSQGIQRYEPRLADLRERLGGLESSLTVQQDQLSRVQSELRTARSRLVRLRVELKQDRAALASQLVAQYKDPSPNLINVVMSARGFKDLLETTRSLSNVARQNAEVTQRVGAARVAVAKREQELAGVERRQATQTAAVLSERDQVAAIQQSLLQRQSRFVRSKASAKARLASLEKTRRRLEQRLTELQARAAGYDGPVPNLTGGYEAHAGAYGFFPATGTNYSVGDEPTLAGKLDVLGRTLHLHLIGLSGYRTPQHSVEVGGFPNDPHTRGEASDTPGVEGVPEATLNRFGLTRPFGGAAEADHIQLVGSI